jgi:beta-aspartyl-peptidase (threonine type)
MPGVKHFRGRASFTPRTLRATGGALAAAAMAFAWLAPAPACAADAQPLAIVIHGGAGVINRAEMTSEREARYRAGLEAARDAGYAVLERGGSSLDAVTAAVRTLEDDPQFNAGRGAVLNHDGIAELDSSIMDGKTLRAGAVAGVKHVKNPVELARLIMEKSPHVLLVGTGAEEFALEQGVVLVPNSYFRTDARVQQLERALKEEKEKASQQQPAGATRGARAVGQAPWPMGTTGTVGAVALDRDGNLAAATSTGGLTNKRPGRVGDSPLIGAGTYANNTSCAVSATGDGEFFIRSVVAHDICALVAYKQLSLEAAAREVIHEKIEGLKATGGVIALDKAGHVVADFNSEGMFRASRDSRGRKDVAIYRGR